MGAEVALACALLVSSALLVRTVGQMTRTPTGVDADDTLTTTVQLTPRAVGAPAGASAGTRGDSWPTRTRVFSRRSASSRG